MENATIYFYNLNGKLEPSKLFMIEDIEQYLASINSTPPYASIQYQKIELKMFLKVILSQSYSSPLQNNSYTYVKIVNSDNVRPAYFYIDKMKWKAENCIELELIMDTLNTVILGVDYTFNAKTVIKRQHKDRIVEANNPEFTLKARTSETIFDELCFNAPTLLDMVSYSFAITSFYEDTSSSDNYIYVKFPKIVNERYVIEDDAFYKINEIKAVSRFGGRYYIQFNYVEGGETTTYHEYWLRGSERHIIIIKANPNLEDEEITSYLINNNATFTTIFMSRLQGVPVYTNIFYRNIDLVSEGLNPTLFNKGLKVLTDTKEDLNQNWYLVYKSNVDNNELIDCYLYPENETRMGLKNVSLANGYILPSMLAENTNYYILLDKHDSAIYSSTFKDSDGNTLYSSHSDRNLILKLTRRGDFIVYALMNFLPEYELGVLVGYFASLPANNSVTDYIQIVGSENVVYGTSNVNYNNSSYDNFSLIPSSVYGGSSFNISTFINIKAYSTLDRSDSRLIKIIKLPYCPYNFLYEDSYYQVDNNWEVGTGGSNLKLASLNIKFENTLTFNVDEESFINPLSKHIFELDQIETISLSNRNDDTWLESKKYNSEFHYEKLIYDSFTFIYKGELMNFKKYMEIASYINNPQQITFYMTSTINSRFAFEINEIPYSLIEEDFYNWVIVARNNEEVIYNSSYVNYIRTGYNYDIKNKNTASQQAWTSVGVGVLGTAMAFVGAVVSEGATLPLAIAGVMGSVNTVTSVVNAINTTSQNERSIREKLDTLKGQSVSVIGSDDIDLLERYSNNRLQYTVYEVSSRVNSLLTDLFYYYGYKDNLTGVPNLNTRIYFNYLQCEPEFDINSKLITKEILTELTNIMKTGFTLIHHYNNEWDTNQTKQNLETSLIRYVTM